MKRIGGIWHLSTHFLSPALLCINYDLSLGISKCYSASSLEDKGLKQRKNLQILFTQNWYSKVSKHLSFLWQIGLVLWPPSHSLCGDQHVVNVGISNKYPPPRLHPGICVWWRENVSTVQPRVWQLPPSVTANVELNFVHKCQTLLTLPRKM